MSVNNGHDSDSPTLPVEDARHLPTTEAEVQGYSHHKGGDGPPPAPQPPPSGGGGGGPSFDMPIGLRPIKLF